MSERKIDPYYQKRAEEIVALLIKMRVIEGVNANDPVKGMIADFLADELQETAESAARWREMALKAEALLQKRQSGEQKA